MKDGDVLRLIGRIVREEAEKLGIEVERVILFGSRARGEEGEESDWDILVVVKGNIERRRKSLLSARIGARVARELLVPVDVIVTTKERWLKYSRVVGTIEEVAANEGVPV